MVEKTAILMAQTAEKLDIPLLATEINIDKFGRTLTLIA